MAEVRRVIAACHRKKVAWSVSPELLGFGAPVRVTVKDTKSGNIQTLIRPELADGALATDFDAYEYRLFEIRPVR